MTAGERTKSVLDCFDWQGWTPSAKQLLYDSVEFKIRDAVEEEREACAKVADQGLSLPVDPKTTYARIDKTVAATIAAAIRARREPAPKHEWFMSAPGDAADMSYTPAELTGYCAEPLVMTKAVATVA